MYVECVHVCNTNQNEKNNPQLNRITLFHLIFDLLTRPVPIIYTHPTRSTIDLDRLLLGLFVLGMDHTLLGSECSVWAPCSGGTRSSLLHHPVNLLKRETLGLGNEEVRVHQAGSAETTPDKEDRGLHVTVVSADHVRSNDGNDGVPEPVGGSGQSNTAGTNGDREDLANENPGTRTPGRGEEEDVDGDQGDLGIDSGDVVGDSATAAIRVGLVETGSNTDNGDDELADEHTEGTEDEKRTTTVLLNSVERERSGEDVDKGENERHQEGVADSTGGLQEGGGEVEDEVNTSPLLHHLKRGTENGAAQIGLLLPERTSEAVLPASEPASIGDGVALVFLVGNNLSDFGFDVFRITGLATKFAKSSDSIIDTALLDVVTRRVGKEQETDTKNNSPDVLKSNGNTVGSGVVAVLGTIDDARGQQQTNGNAELVATNESATDCLGALFTG